MIIVKPEYKWSGDADMPAFWWAIEVSESDESAPCLVLETWDEGKTWITNCSLDTFEECEGFISAWFADR